MHETNAFLRILAPVFATAVLTFFVGCGAPKGSGAAPTPVANPSGLSDTTTLHGTVDSGGGRAVVCRSAAGAVQSVRSLDLYESDHTSRLTPAPSLATLDQEWQRFAVRISTRFADPAERSESLKRVLAIKDQFLAQIRFVSEKEARLHMIDDSKEAFTPECPMEQLANWLDDETILVQKELWDAMDARNQAALIAHEFLYDAYRSFGARTSLYSRRVVGLTFSTRQLMPLTPANDAAFVCESETPANPDNHFAVVRDRVEIAIDGPGAVSLNFLSYPTQILLEPLRLALPTILYRRQ